MAAAAAAGVFPVQPADFVMNDVRRAREFYHYLQPDNLLHPDLRRRDSTIDVSSDNSPSLSNALTPFCQLAVLRCKCRKSMLNVMDRDVMYFLAEATKESKEEGETSYEFVEDPILMRCSTVPLKGRICEMTIALDASQTTPMFVIPDLTQSDFSQMGIVTGPPYYRFYAGVPITTREGINIGSLAVMDTSPRPNGLTKSEANFLATSVRQIMQYLEINRQAIEGQRCRRMAEGLEAFIAGKRCIQPQSHLLDKSIKRRSKLLNGTEPSATDGTKGHHAYHGGSQLQAERSYSIDSIEHEASTSEQSSDSDEGWTKADDDVESRSHTKTFGRAANILRQCFGDLGEDGAVTFVSIRTRSGKTPISMQRRRSVPFVPASNTANPMSQVDGEAGDGEASLTESQSSFIAYSTESEPYMGEKGLEQKAQDIDDEMLQNLMKRYPGGRLWSIDVNTSSSSEDDRAMPPPPIRLRKRSRRKQMEMDVLRRAFPSALQVLYAPLWDATIGSFAHACFVATTLDTRSFSSTVELPFLNSFCSTLMAECSRLDTMVADKQKSDFVGTISHEMRSPLHGLLASVEFLTETDLTGFQKSLIDTVDSCGRTLLDTINHVLDFSKVNSFQKVWQASNKKSWGSKRNNFLGPDNSSKSLSHGAPPLLQLFGVTDVSCVLEEVVDGLVLGHTYNSGIDITDVSRQARGRGAARTRMNGASPEPVDIIVDVEQADWNFLTQPGAVRRIIMNITGNAIKYTTQGSIHVRLRLKASTEPDGNESMIFTVTDTGKGISQEFLSSRLFVPFAQENSLAPGTGLGMSIVRSIVLMLGGTIDVKSAVNQGTTVEVALPMKRPLPGQTSTQTTPWSGASVSSATSGPDDSITYLQNHSDEGTITFYQPKTEADNQLGQVLHSYIRKWYDFQFVDSRLYKSCAVVIVREHHLENLIQDTVGTPGNRPALVVMCSVSSKHSAALLRSLEERISSVVEFVSTPCGPHKLARSIRMAQEKKQAQRPISAASSQLIPSVFTPTSPGAPRTALEPVTEELREMDLNRPGESDKAKLVQATETFAASQASQNAQMALHEPLTARRTPRTHASEGDSFPFPTQTQDASRVRRERNRSLSSNSQPRNSLSGSTTPLDTPRAIHPASTPKGGPVNPHVLLVDDNKINLRLLETYLRTKRKYTRICQAEDGEQAVNAVTSAQQPFEVIFMDISMPVLNGFEATRAIRQFEHEKSDGGDPGAMIIALTGLASGKDQAEVFDSGCDIYMTKPVSFKEVGKLLDHWEAHQSPGMVE
ncbi:hypothetical protein LTR99_009391 [Exophiala xenobiotica]|uniref:LOV domain-containing protein n=1 Tax=Vermiconidia calcicola TaxID=1690605 RepID=A0AAV9PY42_9PEZI|nr:hypothetical protein LTR96_005834 [Exophiala xenobiotica]KAK5530933.1 hypothetical protein LTR25_008790 [Vermiconidia calcicola]KAK5544425.1 hypothetical protein LTR23_004513 [Chaetothyriales sp. CCFEE 6169]KAK5294585.1 hypothetical protein LTR99_009391 [Exophiala xenobiotica]KAK5337391.1 hypothetical protein LTR98_006506 [Exophiala xenobiotica]